MTCKLLLALAMSVIVLVGCGLSKDVVKETVAEIIEENKDSVWCLCEVTSVFLVEESSNRYTGWVEYKLVGKKFRNKDGFGSSSQSDFETTRSIILATAGVGRLEIEVFVDGDQVMVQWE
jgi:cell division protein FtsI/penicillin-binding protein 2